jgi:hypothetical protein
MGLSPFIKINRNNYHVYLMIFAMLSSIPVIGNPPTGCRFGSESTPINTPINTKAAPASRIGLNASWVNQAEAAMVTKGIRTNWYEILEAGQRLRIYRNIMNTAHVPKRIR